MNPSTDARPVIDATPRWQLAVCSGILGWILDAFDFFVVVFLLDTLSAHFHAAKVAIVFSLTLTLAARPLGALLFGALADRFGRRLPLVFCIAFFSVVTVFSGLAPTYVVFLTLRGLYGIGMGGYWGIGASYALENAPSRWRGVLSGVMQSGYPLGYLFAALAMQLIVPVLGWRSMFMVGTSIATLIIVLTLLAPESGSWIRHRRSSLRAIFRELLQHIGIFAYLLLAMTIMSCLSHGTQDLYPDFLRSVPGLASRHLLGMDALFAIPVLYNLCAIIGGPLFGHISQRSGRRHAIIFALLISLLSIPAWAFGNTLAVLTLGSCFMQAGVQGAFGVIPAHLIELSPSPVRSLFPGFVYQFGALLASPTVSFEYLLRDRLGYPAALAAFEGCTVVLLLLIFAFGPERLNRDFYSE